MKHKAFKISQNTLFVYKTVKSVNNRVTDGNVNTEPSSMMTTTVSGIASPFLK